MKDWIRRLTIEGFQSHSHTVVEFDEGFNVIVGATGSGKSALFRSITLILFNELEDTNFITQGMDRFEGTIEFASGKIVTRIRDKKDNIYVLKKGNEEPITLSGFGEGPVQEVLDFHGIKPIRIGKKDRFVSFHSQHEQPFFLSESAADKAKMIGSIAKTDVVDVAIADLAADIKRETVRYNALKSEIKEQTAKVAEFDHIEEMKEDSRRINHLLKKIMDQKEVDIKVFNTASRIEDMADQYKKLGRVITRKSSLDRAFEILNFVSAKRDKCRALEMNFENITDGRRKMTRCQNVIDRIPQKELVDVAAQIEYLAKHKETAKKVRSISEELEGNIARLKRYLTIQQFHQDIPEVERKLVSLGEKKTKLKELVSASARLDNEVERFQNGTTIIGKRRGIVSSAEQEIREEIERNPICPVCGSDMSERENAVMNA